MHPLPSLRHLRYLVALADRLHFGQAADACAVTQSTLSAGIRELESVLGVQVAERTRRSVILTPIGHRLAERARHVLRLVDDMADEAADAVAPMAGTIEIGAIPTVGPFLLPRVIPHLRTSFPRLRFAVREDKTAALLERLASGRLDVVLMAFPYETPGCETLALFDDAYRFACAADHPMARAAAVDLDAMAGESLMLLERDHCLHSHALPVFEVAPEKALTSFAATSLPTLVAMVAEDMGTTLLPDLAIQAGVAAASRIAIRPLAGPSNARTVGLAWRRQAARADTFRRLGACLRGWADDHIRPWRDPDADTPPLANAPGSDGGSDGESAIR
jgi:LysR family hydrogen peroxide-inducible transcriptional activator